MQTVVILIHLMIVLAMVGLVLIQKSEGGGLGVGGGGGGGFLSSRGPANVLPRSTAIRGGLFSPPTLFLSWYASSGHKPRSTPDPGGAGPAGAPQGQPAAPPAPSGP